MPGLGPIDGLPVRHAVRGRTKRLLFRHLLFLFKDGSTASLAKRDLTDVGISSVLHTGLGFFGLLNAASAALPYGWGGHDRRGPKVQRFHVLHWIQEGLGPLCYTGSLVSVRRVTLDDPDSTACLLAKPVSLFGCFAMTVLKSVY